MPMKINKDRGKERKSKVVLVNHYFHSLLNQPMCLKIDLHSLDESGTEKNNLKPIKYDIFNILPPSLHQTIDIISFCTRTLHFISQLMLYIIRILDVWYIIFFWTERWKFYIERRMWYPEKEPFLTKGLNWWQNNWRNICFSVTDILFFHPFLYPSFHIFEQSNGNFRWEWICLAFDVPSSLLYIEFGNMLFCYVTVSCNINKIVV